MIILEGRRNISIRNICIESKCPLNGSGLFNDYDLSETHSYVHVTRSRIVSYFA